MFIPAYHNTLKQALDLEKKIEEEKPLKQREDIIGSNRYVGITGIIAGAALTLIGVPVVGLPLFGIGYGFLQAYAKQKEWFWEDPLISEEYKQTIFPKKTYSSFGVGLTVASVSALLINNSVEYNENITPMMNWLSGYLLFVGLVVLDEDNQNTE
ncbi:MAG: hypothetical protein WC916_01960 [Candidatus Woesearchaeota archaeon]